VLGETRLDRVAHGDRVQNNVFNPLPVQSLLHPVITCIDRMFNRTHKDVLPTVSNQEHLDTA